MGQAAGRKSERPEGARLTGSGRRAYLPAAMKLEVNGDAVEVPEGLSVSELLEHLKVPRGRVAVEVNREVVGRADHAARRLSSGDRVEIVAFVGGG